MGTYTPVPQQNEEPVQATPGLNWVTPSVSESSRRWEEENFLAPARELAASGDETATKFVAEAADKSIPIFRDEEGNALTKEKIITNPEYMDIVDKQLYLLHGQRHNLLSGDFKDQSADERFERWQGINRRIKVGNTPTMANLGLQYYKNMTEEEQAEFGKGLVLFDSMSGRGDVWDATKDYIAGAVFDPVTLLSMGAGSAITKPIANSAVTGVRALAIGAAKKALKAGATREVANAAMKQVARDAFKSLVKTQALNALKLSAVDIAANVGTDVLEQNIRIDSGAQEDYSWGQTLMAGGLSVGIPVIVGVTTATRAVGRSKAATGSLMESTAKTLDTLDMDPAAIRAASTASVNPEEVARKFSGLFAGITDANLKNKLNWDEAKIVAEGLLDESGIPLSFQQKEVAFFEIFFKGTVDKPGLFEEMAAAGARFNPNAYTPTGEAEKITKYTADLVGLLPDETVSKMVSDFEVTFGSLPENFPRTATDMSAAIIRRTSESGRVMGEMSFGARLLQDSSLKNLASDMAKQAEEEAVATANKRIRAIRFAQGVWKKMLTSHIATTAANVKGWKALYTLNTAADYMQGVLYLGSSILKAGDDGPAWKAAMQASNNAFSSGTRRLINIINPVDTLETAKKLLEANPKIKKDLFRYLAGDSGMQDALQVFGLEGSKIARGADKFSDFAQRITAVKLQDELTKNFSFASAVEGFIIKKYGGTPADFFRRSDWQKVITSSEFHTDVMLPALDRALRETASKPFYSKVTGTAAGSPIQTLANTIEVVSAAPAGGLIVPFGKFFNNTVAFSSDFSGMTLVKRWITRKSKGKLDLTPGSKGSHELWADAVVGGGLALTYLHNAFEKIDKGLAWNQEETPEGDLIDVKYDWPWSSFALLGQLGAHWWRDDTIPEELAKEAADIYFKNTFDEVTTVGRVGVEMLSDMAALDFKGVTGELATFLTESGSRVLSGAIRPLDPLNETAKLLIGNSPNSKDRRENFWAQSLRYVDVFFETNLEERTPATRESIPPDYGKQVGTRFVPKVTTTEMVQNSLGKVGWRTASWDGPPEVKNRLDAILFNEIEFGLNRMIDKHPKWFDMSYDKRNRLYEIELEKAKKRTKELFQFDSSETGQLLQLQQELAKIPAKDLEFAKDYSGIEASTDHLLNTPEGRNMLRLLIETAKKANDIREDLKY